MKQKEEAVLALTVKKSVQKKKLKTLLLHIIIHIHF